MSNMQAMNVAVDVTALLNNSLTPITPVMGSGGVGTTLTYSVTPELPAGLSLSSSGVLSGTPTVAAAGALYTVTVTDEAKFTASAQFSLTVSTRTNIGNVITEVQGFLQSIAAFQNKVVFVYDENDLADKVKGIKVFPAAGIIYEGLRSVGEDGPKGHTHRVGMSGEIVVSIVLIMQPETLFKADAKTPVILLLDSIRGTIQVLKHPLM